MAEISLSADIVIPNGPKVGLRRTLEVEAFDSIEVTVAAEASDEEVQLQPGGAGQVQFLLIAADWYGPELTYKLNDATGDERALDQPHLFSGAGAVSLLDGGAPTTLFLSNSTTGNGAKPAKVQILIGRKALAP